MKMRSGLACLVAAVAAVSIGSSAFAQVALTWDADPSTAGMQDGPGTWDLTSLNWLNGASNVAWSNGNDAIFGTLVPGNNAAVMQGIDINGAIAVRNMTFGSTAGGSTYGLSDYGGVFSGGAPGSLTLNGDVTKDAGAGTVQFFLVNSGLTLGAGQHNFSIRDSPSDDAPEVRLDCDVRGTGGISLNNANYESWGTLSMSGNNSYAGQTLISRGRLAITSATALGTTAGNTVISGAGTLNIGSNNNIPNSNLTINEPIVIQRNTYAGGDALDGGSFAHYPAALITGNGSGTTTFTGTLTVDSTDARIRAQSSMMVIQNPITVTGAANKLVIDGDFGGYIRLAAANPALAANGVTLMGGGELYVDNDSQIGGANAPITMNGGTIRFVNGYATTFGTHVLNTATFNGGVDVDEGKTFTVDRELGSTTVDVGTFSKRGLGTLNFNSVVNLRGGQTYWDAGTVNVNSAVQFNNLHLRSSTVNIGTGGSVTLTGAGGGAYNSFGQDSTGTNGGPDIAVINLTGNGSLAQTGTGDPDFNISDNANTRGTINISGTATFSTSGRTYLGKNAGAVGVINQSGGAVNINRTGDFALVIGRDAGTGTYTKTGGTLNSLGEMFVGQGALGTGTFTQTGGTTTVNNWFVLGREGAAGEVNLSGGSTFNKTGGGNFQIDAGAANGLGTPSTLTVDNATLNVNNELQVGTDNVAANGVLNVRNNAVITVGSWFSVGRSGSTGTLNLQGGTITKTGNAPIYVGEGANQNSVINVSGGSIVSAAGAEFWVGNGGSSKGTVNLSAGSISVDNWFAIGRNGTSQGIVNITGGTINKLNTANPAGNALTVGSGGTATGTVNQSAGTVNNVTSESWLGEAGGSGTYNLSGGVLNVGLFDAGHTGAGTGTLNVSGTGAMTATTIRVGEAGAVNGAIALSGGSITATEILARNSTGTKTFTWTGGRLSTGSFTFASTLNNSGTGVLAPGGFDAVTNAPLVGTTSITGGYTQAVTASMAIDISSATLFDKITAGASSVVNGSIAVNVLAGFSTSGLSFDILTLAAGTLTGTPTLTGASASLFTVSIVGGNILRLSGMGATVIPGDYNRDGFVDAADYTVWADNFGRTGTGLPGDGNNDGVVNAADYTVWADHFGQGTPHVAAVPEPTALALVPALLPMLSRRRRA